VRVRVKVGGVLELGSGLGLGSGRRRARQRKLGGSVRRGGLGGVGGVGTSDGPGGDRDIIAMYRTCLRLRRRTVRRRAWHVLVVLGLVAATRDRLERPYSRTQPDARQLTAQVPHDEAAPFVCGSSWTFTQGDCRGRHAPRVRGGTIRYICTATVRGRVRGECEASARRRRGEGAAKERQRRGECESRAKFACDG
jgi:hypothetical protein